MTEVERITFIHDQIQASWVRALKQWRNNPDYQKRFPHGERESLDGIANQKQIKAEARERGY